MKRKQEMERMLTEINESIKTVSKELERLPAGRLRVENRRGSKVPVQSYYINGRRERLCIKDNLELQAQLFKAELLKKEIKNLEYNQKQISYAAAHYVPFDLGKNIQEVEAKCNCGGAALMQLYSDTFDQRSAWAAEYKPTDFKASKRLQITSRGLYVRSKSEVLIAEKLYEYKIPFRYEQPIQVKEITLYPDFTIMRGDGKLFYWEHEGLTNSQEYVNWQIRKSQLYASIGILPWDNFIVTYDTQGGMIDLRIIESEIKNKLLF